MSELGVSAIKFSILLARRPGLSHDEFVTYHRDQHAPLFMSIAAVQQHVRHYVQQQTLGISAPGLPAPAYDGITELWFDDVDGIIAVSGTPSTLPRSAPMRRSSATCTTAAS